VSHNGLALQVFTSQQLDRIEETAFRLLEEVGISLQHRRAVEMLSGRGCRVKGERVLIPSDVVYWSLSNVRRASAVYSADGSTSLALGEKGFRVHDGGSVPNILDFEAGAARPATVQDLDDATRLLDALPNVDVVIPLVSPQDVPGPVMLIASFEAMLRHTRKPILAPPAEKPDEVRYLVELASACCGGREAFRLSPTISIMVSPVSPLTFTKNVAGAILAVAESGAPLFSLPAPSLGATAPITLAGALAQQHAEILASIVLAAASCPGAPFVYCSRIIPIDMRLAISAWGGPEIGLASAAAAQLAHRHGFVCDAYGLATSAPRLDPQFAYERLANALVPALGGVDLLSGVGSLENGMTVSLDAAVIDDEIIGLIRHVTRGYEVNDETLAFDVMEQVIGRDGMFLGEEHTVEFMRRGGLWMPEISERASGEEARGVNARAHERVKELLRTHQVEPLPEDVGRHLTEIMERAQRELVEA
jgi:trimethylamine:corrinoid methyltransferase-like protein